MFLFDMYSLKGLSAWQLCVESNRLEGDAVVSHLRNAAKNDIKVIMVPLCSSGSFLKWDVFFFKKYKSL